MTGVGQLDTNIHGESLTPVLMERSMDPKIRTAEGQL